MPFLLLLQHFLKLDRAKNVNQNLDKNATPPQQIAGVIIHGPTQRLSHGE